MGDDFIEVTHQSYFQRIGGAFWGILLGLGLIIGAVIVLYVNEGRYDISRLARAAISVTDQSNLQELAGKPISVTGELLCAKSIGDNNYLLPGSYVMIKRAVKIYAWHEHTTTHTQRSGLGGQDTITTYHYQKEWLTHVPDSARFKQPEGHMNSPLRIEPATFFSERASINNLSFMPAEITILPCRSLILSTQTVKLTGGARLHDNQIFVPVNAQSSIEQPQVGDVLVSYCGVAAGQMATVFGTVRNNVIEPYRAHDTTLYHLYAGSRERAIEYLHEQHAAATWGLRVLGFVMLWLGLYLLLAPLAVLWDIIPFAGGFISGLLALSTGLAALGLSVFVVFISTIMHSIWLLLFAVAVALVILLWRLRKHKVLQVSRKN